tara:strand:- start:285 stop:593 length:309 start_codon:yes stop_codon:yes gene_type:complete
MKAICIDSSNKPDRISKYEWIEEGVVYTITKVVELGTQSNKLGIALQEVELTSASAPYKYYSLERFLIIPDEIREDFEIRLKTDQEKSIDIYAKDANLESLV